MALATFGVQKLRGKSTKRSLRDAMMIGGLGQLGGMAGVPGMQAFGQTSLPGMTGQFISPAGTPFLQQLGQTTAGSGIKGLYGQAEQTAPLEKALETAGNDPTKIKAAQDLYGGSGFANFSPGAKIAAAAFALPLLSGDDGPNKMYLPIPNQNYTKYANYGFGATPTGFQTRDYATGIDSPLVQPGEFRTPEEVLGDEPTQSFKAVEMNTGGLASIAKFNEGGMGQVLPSKMTHDENDANNYDRANGFVMDGTGHGKDHEDTMLAQLADGEFVSRSHAVLGAGIIAGASPSDKSDQRKKGAKFFYDQQKQFKRIFDLINANKTKH
jgi:hypothetical protein